MIVADIKTPEDILSLPRVETSGLPVVHIVAMRVRGLEVHVRNGLSVHHWRTELDETSQASTYLTVANMELAFVMRRGEDRATFKTEPTSMGSPSAVLVLTFHALHL